MTNSDIVAQLIEQGRAMGRAQRLDLAERAFRQALTIAPDNLDALVTLGGMRLNQAMQRGGKDAASLDEAEYLVRKAIGRSPGPLEWTNDFIKQISDLRQSLPVTFSSIGRLVREDDLAGILGSVTTLVPSRQVPLVSIPGIDNGQARLCYRFPAIRAFELQDAIVDSQSELPATQELTVVSDLLDVDRHIPAEEGLGQIRLSAADRQVLHRSMMEDRPPGMPAEGIVLTSTHWMNWAHFLTEQLPKVLLADNYDPWRGLPMIVSGISLRNCHLLFRRLISPGRKVALLGARLRLSRAAYISTVGYCPFDYVSGSAGEPATRLPTDAAFSPDALNLVRQSSQRLAAPGRSPYGQRIYLRRNARVRQVRNSQEVEALLVKLGFAAVSPEQLGLEEQIRVFADARLIVGQAGAAMANMVFSNPGTHLMVLAGLTPYSNYHYFGNMAAALGHGLSYQFCRTVGTPHHPSHADIEVDLMALEEALKSVDK